jgi:phosphohistidine phosphatase
MKKLFIVRHAKSSWDFPELDDYERPLNKRGKRDAPEMGRRLLQRQIRPDGMIASPAKRAADTSKLIANEISFSIAEIKKEPMFYHASNISMISVLRSIGKDIDTLMIFGHNPGLTDLVNFLSGTNIFNIPTCGIAEIEFDVSSWAEIEKDAGELKSFDYPKKLSSDTV